MQYEFIPKDDCTSLVTVLAKSGLTLSDKLRKCQISVVPSRQRKDLVQAGFTHVLSVSWAHDLHSDWVASERFYLSSKRFSAFKRLFTTGTGLKEFYITAKLLERYTKVNSFHCVSAPLLDPVSVLFGFVIDSSVVIVLDDNELEHIL